MAEIRQEVNQFLNEYQAKEMGIIGVYQNSTRGNYQDNKISNNGVPRYISPPTVASMSKPVNYLPTPRYPIAILNPALIQNFQGRPNMLCKDGETVPAKMENRNYPCHPQPMPPQRTSIPQNYFPVIQQCYSNRRLFEDPEFPIYNFYDSQGRQIVWLRPHEIVSFPQLINKEQSRFDVVQGELGDCWLLAAMANLTLRDELFYRSV